MQGFGIRCGSRCWYNEVNECSMNAFVVFLGDAYLLGAACFSAGADAGLHLSVLVGVIAQCLSCVLLMDCWGPGSCKAPNCQSALEHPLHPQLTHWMS